MEFTSWESWMLVTRGMLYIGMAAAIGGACSLQLIKAHRHLKKSLVWYTLVSACIGMLGALSHFFVRVGATLEEGAAGMFEPDMVSIMWESAVGDALLLRSIGFLIFIMAVFLHTFIRSESRQEDITLGVLEVFIALTGIGFIAFSFSEAGHAVDQPLFFQLVLSIHVLLTAWWMGSLYPLWLVCHRMKFNLAHVVLERFGQLAVVAVVILFSCGLFLSYELTGWLNLFSSEYGAFLLTKVALVFVILALAAFHKLYLVPQLLNSEDSGQLKKSIMLEKLVGIGILGVTTVMTTLVGPVH